MGGGQRWVATKAKSRSRLRGKKLSRLRRPAKRLLGAVEDFELYKELFWFPPFY